jgi:hypothetical protein
MYSSNSFVQNKVCTVKKVIVFPVPSRDVPVTNQTFPGQEFFKLFPAGDGENDYLFYSVEAIMHWRKLWKIVICKIQYVYFNFHNIIFSPQYKIASAWHFNKQYKVTNGSLFTNDDIDYI